MFVTFVLYCLPSGLLAALCLKNEVDIKQKSAVYIFMCNCVKMLFNVFQMLQEITVLCFTC